MLGMTEPLFPVRRGQRPDGQESRERLLLAALRLFAQQGYANTSIREIAQAAEANIGAISYYFGDKAGLYRAAFVEPFGDPSEHLARLQAPAASLTDTLRAYYQSCLAPLSQGDLAQQCLRLHFRELTDPTGLWSPEEIRAHVEPTHLALLQLVAQHLGMPLDQAQADDDLQHLAMSLDGLVAHLYVWREMIDVVRPSLLATPEAVTACADRLARQGAAMLEAEAARRGRSMQ